MNRRSPLIQRLVWRLEALGFDLFSGAARLLPVDFVSWSFGKFVRVIGPLTSAHRTATLGLAIAFPEIGEAECETIARDQWENFGRYMGEFPLMDHFTLDRGRVDVVGLERLERLARDGRPAVLISAHLSNFEVMAAIILSAGVTCDITYRAANNPFVDQRIREGRARYGVTLFAPKGAEGARDLLEALNAGRSIALLNDQRYDNGVESVFFGLPVRTNPAAVRLARRFGTFILPMSVTRLRGARFRVTVHDPIEVPQTGDRNADQAAGVALIDSFIEARVREHPEEWWWMHKRWSADAYTRVAELQRPRVSVQR